MNKQDIKIEKCSFKNCFGVLICTFTFIGAEARDAKTTIRIILDDEQTGADVVITNITTLPFCKTMHGYGSIALQSLLSRATEKKLTKIVAVQVQDYCEEFWVKNGFKKIGNITNDFIFAQ